MIAAILFTLFFILCLVGFYLASKVETLDNEYHVCPSKCTCRASREAMNEDSNK